MNQEPVELKISQFMVDDLQVLAHLAETTNTNVPFTGDRIRQIIRVILDLRGKIIDLETPQYRDLSNEEIDSLIAQYKIGEFSGFYVDKVMTESMQRRYKNVLDFANAILKKASEK